MNIRFRAVKLPGRTKEQYYYSCSLFSGTRLVEDNNDWDGRRRGGRTEEIDNHENFMSIGLSVDETAFIMVAAIG